MAAFPRIASLATAVPEHILDQREVANGSMEIFSGSFSDWSRLAPVYANAAIEKRHSCVPIEWYKRPSHFAERNRLYVENAVDLLEVAARRAIAQADLRLDDIDGVVAVSTSGIATPSLDALLIERLALRRDILRLPIFGLGCVGGALGLARTAQLARAAPGKRFLFLVVELCGLTFRFADRSKSNVIATALFGDGAAAAVVSDCDGGPAIAAWGEHTWPDSLNVMGWDVRDDGLAVVFSRDIPALVRREMRGVTDAFLRRHDLALDQINSFLCHPGGAKVIEALEDIYGLPDGGLTHSRAILREYGNMSAATVLFVIERALAAGETGRQLVSSLGPGFTAGFVLLDHKV